MSEEVWEELELAPGSAISSQALGAMDSLNLSTASVGSLAGLECAVGLRLLALRSDGAGGNSPHTVQDLSPIVDLPQLSQLTLSYPALDDISALAGLVSLRQLDLSRNSVTDLAPLAELPELYSLAISEAPVSDVSALAGIATLATLYARDTPITDVAPLVGCESLYKIHLEGTSISDVSVLATMPSLRSLDISRTAVTDLSAFSESQLGTLFASETQIDGLPEKLPISNGRFAGNGIVDISPLLTWPALAEVDLSNNAIDDVSPLLELPWEIPRGSCLVIDLVDNPLGEPDSEAILQQLCESSHVRISADRGLGCLHEACELVGE